jgi:RimJ/RimL family protein N-acetyltransferase
VKTLETERLRVRPLTPEDAVFIVELVNEPAWLQFIGDRHIRSIEDATAYLAHGPIVMYARHGLGLGAVQRKADGVRVGICGLLQRDNLPEVDLGYALLARFAGHGYAQEAAAACLAHGWQERGLKRIVALTALENERSIRLLGKLGFAFERLIRLEPNGPESRLFARSAPE